MHQRRQPKRPHDTVLCACLVVLLMIGIGALEYALEVPLADIVYLCIAGGVVISLIVWIINTRELHDRQQRERMAQRRRAHRQSEPHAPVEFNDRLANYLHRPPDEVAEPEPRYRSKMPFWCRVEVITRVGPKSRLQIRELLERIRRAVHGRFNGHG